MLRTRIITALVLLAILLPALMAASPWPFALVTLVFIAAAGWEWGRLVGAPGGVAVGMGTLLALACVAALGGGWAERTPEAVWALAAVVWVLGGAWVLRAGATAWSRWPSALRAVLGLALLWAAWLAIARSRTIGLNFILSVFCLAWAADIAAYFGGRAFGRRKLAPAISPGKSWEGVWSGMAGVLALALAWTAFDQRVAVDSPSLYTLLVQSAGVPLAVLALLALAAMSVVGDLFESLVKRAAGAKDSSGLLPGHGGVLDRVDALMPVFPIALALLAWSQR